MKRKLVSFLMAVIMMFLATDTTALAANGSVMTDSMALESESPSENQMVSENGTQENQADTS